MENNLVVGLAMAFGAADTAAAWALYKSKAPHLMRYLWVLAPLFLLGTPLISVMYLFGATYSAAYTWFPTVLDIMLAHCVIVIAYSVLEWQRPDKDPN